MQRATKTGSVAKKLSVLSQRRLVVMGFFLKVLRKLLQDCDVRATPDRHQGGVEYRTRRNARNYWLYFDPSHANYLFE